MTSNCTAPSGANDRARLFDLCAELDAIEAVAGERVGGATNGERARIAALEEEIAAQPADSPAAALWRGRRLARACLNGWRGELVEQLARAVLRDSELFTQRPD